ncbi:MAG: glycosyltransferase family 4 protein [Candidatus Babeliales bacterium]
MDSVFMRLGISWFISFLLTFYLVPLCAALAKKLNILDMPDGRIKVHKEPVPYLGGVAVFMGFIASLAIVFPYDNKIGLFLIGTTLLLFVGIVDDLVRIKPYQKFFWQIIAAFGFLKSGLYLKETFFLNNIWTLPLSLLWILTIINAFNLVDVMDGLATTIALCVATMLLAMALITKQYNVALLLLCFLGSLSAFLYYNKPSAKIYLGDAGSLFIGGFLAAIPFLIQWEVYNPYGFITPLIIFLIPLLEVVTLVIVRTYKGIPFYYGSPDHFSIYLQQGGWSKKKILFFVLYLSLFLLLIAVLFMMNRITFLTLSFLLFIILSLWLIAIWINPKARLFVHI